MRDLFLEASPFEILSDQKNNSYIKFIKSFKDQERYKPEKYGEVN